MSINDLSPEIQERIWRFLSKEAGTAYLLELQRLPKRAAVTLPVKDDLGKEIVSTAAAIEDFLKARPETQDQSATKSDRRRGSVAALALENRGLRSRIAGFKVIDIAPASAQFHASFPNAKSFDVSKVAPNVAPPFDRMILEAVRPKGLEHLSIDNFGLVISAVPFNSKQQEMTDWMYEIPKWNLRVRVLLGTDSDITEQPFTLHFYVYANGSLATPSPKNWGVLIENDHRLSTITEDRHNQILLILDWFIAPAFFALALLHCKGVTLRVVNQPESRSKKVSRRRGNVVLQHHVIEIRTPQGQVIDGVSLESAAQRGLHIVRGHFSTYTEGSPLFGRLTGTFWIPAHVRGSLSEGLIESDYRVMG